MLFSSSSALPARKENEEMFSGHKQIEIKEEKKECVKSKSPRGETVVAGDFY